MPGRRRTAKGSVLVYVLLMMSVISVLILAGSEMSSQALRFSKNYTEERTARAIREGAVAQLSSNFDLGAVSVPGNVNITIDGTPVAISLVNHPTILHAATATITFTYEGRAYSYERIVSKRPAPHPTFFALYSKKNFTMASRLDTGSGGVNGDVYVKGNVTLTYGAGVINGDLDATGTISASGVTVEGSSYAGATDNLNLPNPDNTDYNNYKTSSRADGAVINGSLFLASLLGALPLIYVDGNVTIRGNFTGYGVIYCTKTVTIPANITYGLLASRLVIISEKGIDVAAGVTTLNGFFYTKEKFTWPRVGACTLNGGVAADEVLLTGDTTINHDPYFWENPSELTKYYMPGVWNP